MVGLQGDGPTRFAGQIKLTREQQRFWMKISAPELGDDEVQFCKDYPVVSSTNVSLIVWWRCAADSEATFSENKSILPMRGNTKTEPGRYKQFAGGSHFTILPDLTYVLFTSYPSTKQFYLEEGSCEKL